MLIETRLKSFSVCKAPLKLESDTLILTLIVQSVLLNKTEDFLAERGRGDKVIECRSAPFPRPPIKILKCYVYNAIVDRIILSSVS